MQYDVVLMSVRKYKGVGENKYISVWVCPAFQDKGNGSVKARRAYYKVYNWTLYPLGVEEHQG